MTGFCTKCQRNKEKFEGTLKEQIVMPCTGFISRQCLDSMLVFTLE